MYSNTVEAREKRCRRALREMDCLLTKSRARHWSYNNQYEYMIYDLYTNGIIAGHRYDMTLEEVEDFCDVSK